MVDENEGRKLNDASAAVKQNIRYNYLAMSQRWPGSYNLHRFRI